MYVTQRRTIEERKDNETAVLGVFVFSNNAEVTDSIGKFFEIKSCRENKIGLQTIK